MHGFFEDAQILHVGYRYCFMVLGFWVCIGVMVQVRSSSSTEAPGEHLPVTASIPTTRVCADVDSMMSNHLGRPLPGKGKAAVVAACVPEGEDASVYCFSQRGGSMVSATTQCLHCCSRCSRLGFLLSQCCTEEFVSGHEALVLIVVPTSALIASWLSNPEACKMWMLCQMVKRESFQTKY